MVVEHLAPRCAVRSCVEWDCAYETWHSAWKRNATLVGLKCAANDSDNLPFAEHC